MLLLHQNRAFNFALSRNRANGEVAIFRLNVVQLGNMVDVYNVGRPRQAHIE